MGADELWPAARRSAADLFAAVGGQVWDREATMVGVTGMPAADFNFCMVDASSNMAEVFGGPRPCPTRGCGGHLLPDPPRRLGTWATCRLAPGSSTPATRR